MSKPRQTIEDAIVLFAGDSGDGSQTIGAQMTQTSAMAGNDVSTHPDFPAEIRAPAGSLAGVSGFQLHFSSRDIYTPGDKCDVLVAMNPAALTEKRDILLNFLNTDLGSWDDLIVDDHMKENPKTLQSDDLLDTAIFFMANGGYRHIPIVDDRYQPIGMVSVLDIMTYLVEHFPQEILTLPPRPIRDAMKAREGA